MLFALGLLFSASDVAWLVLCEFFCFFVVLFHFRNSHKEVKNIPPESRTLDSRLTWTSMLLQDVKVPLLEQCFPNWRWITKKESIVWCFQAFFHRWNRQRNLTKIIETRYNHHLLEECVWVWMGSCSIIHMRFHHSTDCNQCLFFWEFWGKTNSLIWKWAIYPEH
jgi:hypothetical protein